MKRSLYLILALTLIVACKPKEQQGVVEEEVQKVLGPQRHVMEKYHYTDSIADSKIVFTIHREADSTLNIVEDDFGDSYVDNFYHLTIKKNGAEFFSHRFTKDSFSNLSSDLRKTTIFDGFRFVGRENGILKFSVCLSEPDSDLSVPYVLSIGPDGSYTITPDNTPDLDEAEEEEGV